MKSKTPSLTNPHHPLRRVAGHLGFVFAALSLGASLGCSASSKSTAPDRVGPEAELDASATAFHTSDAGPSPTNPSSTDDASAPNDEDEAPETPSSPTTPTLVSTDAPYQPKPSITSNETNTDAPDAGPAPTNGAPTVIGDATTPTDPTQNDAPLAASDDELGACKGNAVNYWEDAGHPAGAQDCDAGGCGGGHRRCEDWDEDLCAYELGCYWEPAATSERPSIQVDASVPEDAALRDEPTPTIVYEVSVCMGDAVHYYEDAGRPVEVVHCDEPGCGSQHRACEDWDESDCEREEGCRWGQQQVVNEGTDTGKRCEGEPLSCDVWSGSCLPGCTEVESSSGRARTCVGTPTPCSSHRYSEACASQLGCAWR